MDGLDDPENTAKVSDSAYSTSCSNSQSRRSHSSKSTHSSSHSSGSSGYCGKPNTTGSSNKLGQPPEKRSKDKDGKKKSKTSHMEVHIEPASEPEARPQELEQKDEANQQEVNENDAAAAPAPLPLPEPTAESMEIASSDTSNHGKEEVAAITVVAAANSQAGQCCNPQQVSGFHQDGFSCVISMLDGVVVCTTSAITCTLGFPKEMWIGRSFIDFIHPKDRNTFASQIMNGVVVPKDMTTDKPSDGAGANHTMCCRLRTYRGLGTGFGIKKSDVTFLPFTVSLTFKDVADDVGKAAYLLVQTTLINSAYKTPFEPVTKPTAFTTRHIANGRLQHMDRTAVPYLGYFPQDICDQDVLLLYHPDDLTHLLQVYEMLLQKGAAIRSQVYRMLAQNGGYVKLETEFSSFINPWSKKLEFISGRHYVVEGPENPDVFQQPCEKPTKFCEEQKMKAQCLRDKIVKTMNEVTAKTSDAAKLATSRRCLELASFMESLIDDEPRAGPADDLRLEIQDQDNSVYERDSVMLGGISPHHENDFKPRTETPLSYNMLNYNETLQRYFESYVPPNEESNDTSDQSNKVNVPEPSTSFDENKFSMSVESYQLQRLTEGLLIKHNSVMEKELIKKHHENRPTTGAREKALNDSRQNKKEHLARCNAPYHPTAAETAPETMPHGIKRPSWQCDMDEVARKHHCTWTDRARHPDTSVPLVTQPTQSYVATSATVVAGAAPWATPGVSVAHALPNSHDVTQQVPMVKPMVGMPPVVPGMLPMYYVPATPTMPMTSYQNVAPMGTYNQAAVPYLMYGQPVFGTPFVYSNIPQLAPTALVAATASATAPATAPASTPAPVSAPAPAPALAPWTPAAHSSRHNPLPLTHSNYEEACKPSASARAKSWRDKKRAETQSTSSSKAEQGSRLGSSVSPTMFSNRLCGQSRVQSRMSFSPGNSGVGTSSDRRTMTESDESRERNSDSGPSAAVPSNGLYKVPQVTKAFQVARERVDGQEESGNAERTDGESSYSSFCSSFFKTDSGSNEESDAKNKGSDKGWSNRAGIRDPNPDFVSYRDKKISKRRGPPWTEQVCVTSELIYKYQITAKNLDEVLAADKAKLMKTEQPSLVNEQLSQLYLELQLNGLPPRLALEEGFTSSGSSGEETGDSSAKKQNRTKAARRKHEYSRLVMIYEEDAPLPSPPEEPVLIPSLPEEPVPSTSGAGASCSK